MSKLQLTATQLAEMVSLIEDGTISGKIAKQILPDLLQVCMYCETHIVIPALQKLQHVSYIFC